MPKRKMTELDRRFMNDRWEFFGPWLREQRLLRGLTQRQAANLAGVSERQWVRYEMGAKVLKKRVRKIARTLNVPYERMLDRAGYEMSLKRNAPKYALARIYDHMCAGKLWIAILQLLELNDLVRGMKRHERRIRGGPDASTFARAVEFLDALPDWHLEIIVKVMQKRIIGKATDLQIKPRQELSFRKQLIEALGGNS